MQINQSEQNSNGKFTAFIGEVEVGHVDYSWINPSKFSIIHTEVHPEYGGKGIGKKLVLHAVAFARGKNAKIKPLCSYAMAVFDKTSDIQDVLE